MSDYDDYDDDADLRERHAQRKATEEQTKVIVWVGMAICFLLIMNLSNEAQEKIRTYAYWAMGIGCVYGFFAWPWFRTGLFLALAAWIVWTGVETYGFKVKEWPDNSLLIVGGVLFVAFLSSAFNQLLAHGSNFSEWWREFRE